MSFKRKEQTKTKFIKEYIDTSLDWENESFLNLDFTVTLDTTSTCLGDL